MRNISILKADRYNTESLLTLYDIFFPQSSQRIHRDHMVFKISVFSVVFFLLCVLCGKQNERILSIEIQYKISPFGRNDRHKRRSK
jgi:hypothetical protein